MTKIEHLTFNEYLSIIGDSEITNNTIHINQHRYNNKFIYINTIKHNIHYIKYETYNNIFVAKLNKDIIGYIKIFNDSVIIYVDPSYRNIGIGLALTVFLRDKYPFTKSGGFTKLGLNNITNYYKFKINNYLSNNGYYNDIKNNVLTTDRVRYILS